MCDSGSDCVGNKLEAQTGPSRIFLEMSLSEYNRPEGENEDELHPGSQLP